jgi:hypothetical protein
MGTRPIHADIPTSITTNRGDMGDIAIGIEDVKQTPRPSEAVLLLFDMKLIKVYRGLHQSCLKSTEHR